MPVNPKDIKVPTTTPHVSRSRAVRLLIKTIEEYRDLLPPDFLSLLVDEGTGKGVADELRRDLRTYGYDLNEGIAAVLSEIRDAAYRIRQYAEEAEAAVGRNELDAQRIEVPELVDKIIKASGVFDEFIHPKLGKESILMRQAVRAALERLKQDSQPSFEGLLGKLIQVVDEDWVQPDEWKENRDFWSPALRAIAANENHPYFDSLFRARLAENEACFVAGLYLASIATSRMVYEHLIKTGVLRIYGKDYVEREKLFKKGTTFLDLVELLEKKTAYDWRNEGKSLYDKGNVMLHDPAASKNKNLNVEGIGDRKLSPNSATEQRRRYRREAMHCTEELERLIMRMELDMKRHEQTR